MQPDVIGLCLHVSIQNPITNVCSLKDGLEMKRHVCFNPSDSYWKLQNLWSSSVIYACHADGW